MGKALIVFDMDGVLIDVSQSYRDVVRLTARMFFEGAANWETLPLPLVSLADIAVVKQSGGLNNDWDLTCRVLSLLMGCVDTTGGRSGPGTDPRSQYRSWVPRCDVSRLGAYLRQTDRPLSRLLDESDGAPHPMVQSLYGGDVGSGNIIKQIFQEIYLGKALFESSYAVPVAHYDGPGYIDRETLLIRQEELDRLSKAGILAIATGRPRMEAVYSLDRFQIADYFSSVYTLDDCLAEEQKRRAAGKGACSLSKPDPFMLDAIAAQFGHGTGTNYYIGDMPDDMIAASRARATYDGIGILLSAPDKDRLREGMQQAGAKHIIDSFEELTYLLRP